MIYDLEFVFFGKMRGIWHVSAIFVWNGRIAPSLFWAILGMGWNGLWILGAEINIMMPKMSQGESFRAFQSLLSY